MARAQIPLLAHKLVASVRMRIMVVLTSNLPSAEIERPSSAKSEQATTCLCVFAQTNTAIMLI